MRVAIYARTSTRDQQSIPMQLEAMREHAERRGWIVAAEIAEQESGAKNDRPGRAEVLDLARRGKIDCVLVWKLNRWGRSTTDLLMTLDELQSHRCGFVSLSESLDFTTPAGRMMAGILAVFAQFEREMIVENVKAGIESYRAKNGRWGRPARAQGKKERIRQLRDAGFSIEKICKELQISRASVYRVCQAPYAE